MSSNEDDAIKSIQTAVRGYLVRKKYGIKNLGSGELTSYSPFLIGNDVPLSLKQLEHYQIAVPFVLVGTSMFRSIDFACKLCGKEVTPKVIIVDNSEQVFKCWQILKRFFSETQLTDGDDFLTDDEGLLNYIIDNQALFEALKGENAYKYFTDFLKLYSFEYVKGLL